MTEYEMTEAQLAKLLESMRPQPAIMLQCGPSPSVQERANAAWEALGKEMGFRHLTARPIHGESERRFYAEPVHIVQSADRIES